MVVRFCQTGQWIRAGVPHSFYVRQTLEASIIVFMHSRLQYGIYEALLDEELKDAIERHPELRSVLGKIDNEEQPTRYAAFVSKVLEQALREEADPSLRFALCNRLLQLVAERSGREHLQKKLMVESAKPLLLEITPADYAIRGMPRPSSPLGESSLFTGSPREPQLAHELQAEMRSADEVDILVSFIKWSGLRLLIPAFDDLRQREIKVRLITTAYMGASDPPAVEWLARQPNVTVRVSFDTERTRLHAKAYHFKRKSGFSVAYIGSANMSHPAMTSGLEWNLKVTAQDMPHILEKFTAEFETYWNSREFIPFDPANPQILRDAVRRARGSRDNMPAVFFDLRPHPFQERILEALERERNVHGRRRNLVIAATGTGKTIVAAFDFKRFYEGRQRQARLLFTAHRQEILEQSVATFRNVLRDHNFGELLVGPHEAVRREHLFCSVGILASRRLWESIDPAYYDYIVIDEALRRLACNPTILSDLGEILEWAESDSPVTGKVPALAFPCPLELHAQYGIREIQTVFGRANLQTAGQSGVGVLHFPEVKAYALLVTYTKTEKEFSPSTMYADYPISRELLHWESQSITARESETGQNLIRHVELGYTILIFARDQKKTNGVAQPFIYLGDAEHVSAEADRPIKIVWRLRHQMPVEMFERNRRGG